jgi:hypothetical protein
VSTAAELDGAIERAMRVVTDDGRQALLDVHIVD